MAAPQSAILNWNLRPRNYEAEEREAAVAFSVSAIDPLGEAPTAKSAAPTADPLESDDPLSLLSKTTRPAGQEKEKDPDMLPGEELVPYLTVRHLSKFAEKDTPSDRFSLRLEQLDDQDAKAPDQILELTFQEVIDLAVQRRQEMIEAWGKDERVRTLKIVIQCCKLLTDVTFPPSTRAYSRWSPRVLDTFGRIVFERISVKAFERPNPGRFRPDEVNDGARETCRNWFYKIASIREMLPRLFIELALCRSYCFLTRDPFPAVMARLSATIRGWAIPHRRLCTRLLDTKGDGGVPQEESLFMQNFTDFAQVLPTINCEQRKKEMTAIHVDFGKYLRVYSPAVQSMLYGVFRSSRGKARLGDLLETVVQAANPPDPLMINHLIELAPADEVASLSPRLVQLIRDDPLAQPYLTQQEGVAYSYSVAMLPVPSTTWHNPFCPAKLYAQLGSQLSQCSQAPERPLALLREVWMVVTEIPVCEHYMEVAEAWIEYTIRWCTPLLGLAGLCVVGFWGGWLMLCWIEETTLSTHPLAHVPFGGSWGWMLLCWIELGLGAGFCSAGPDKETLILLTNAEQHLSIDRAYEKLAGPLESLILKAVRTHPTTAHLLAMDPFLQLYHMLPTKVAATVATTILGAFGKSVPKPIFPRGSSEATSDLVVIHAFFEIAKRAVDTIDSTSPESERAQIGNLLVKFIGKVDCGKDVEQVSPPALSTCPFPLCPCICVYSFQTHHHLSSTPVWAQHLNFLVDCRRAFQAFDGVQQQLCLAVNALAMKVLRLAGGRHNKRTSTFVKATLAYLHVTIPSVAGVMDRIRLFLGAADTALANGMVAQADTFLRMALTLVAEVPPVTGARDGGTLLELLNAITAFMVVMPGHPTSGPLYLFKAMQTLITEYAWSEHGSGRGQALVAMVVALGAMAQRRLPVHYKNGACLQEGERGWNLSDLTRSRPEVDMDSNDSLYQQEAAYLEEVQQLLGALVATILQEIERLGKDQAPEHQRHQALLCIQTVEALLQMATLTPPVAELALKLVTLACRGAQVSPQPHPKRGHRIVRTDTGAQVLLHDESAVPTVAPVSIAEGDYTVANDMSLLTQRVASLFAALRTRAEKDKETAPLWHDVYTRLLSR
ncbi:putative UPF0505 protein C16orf62 [Paratrimastix pyriformis]|uniref:UPF0505 protein C16orf62 n=1 Tax=Paratrimastix pyriformis TaxID=342808 RepID=A0ABQ8UAL4_9EUKA|nr:putative UPF0505 protein C16orf62 [Paratrimastix pyriformis]